MFYSCITERMRKIISNRQPSESIELIEIERFKKKNALKHF